MATIDKTIALKSLTATSLDNFLKERAVDSELSDIIKHSHDDHHFVKVLSKWIFDPKNFGTPSYIHVARWLSQPMAIDNSGILTKIGFHVSTGVANTKPSALVKQLSQKAKIKLPKKLELSQNSRVARTLELFLVDKGTANDDQIKQAFIAICQSYIETSGIFQVHRPLARHIVATLSDNSTSAKIDIKQYIFAARNILEGNSKTFLSSINELIRHLELKSPSNEEELKQLEEQLNQKPADAWYKLGFGA